MSQIDDKIESIYSLLEGINRDLQFELDCIAIDRSTDDETGYYQIGISDGNIYFELNKVERNLHLRYDLLDTRIDDLQDTIDCCQRDWIDDYHVVYRDRLKVEDGPD